MMLMAPRSRPIVYGGPSLQLLGSHFGSRFDIRPPIRRGDLEVLVKERPKPGCVLIADGCFGQTMSVSPVECLRLIKEGWLLLGTSSIGALRAADCHYAGMIGIGHVFMGYRMGYFKSDADVAVRYAGTTPLEVTISYVHADYIARLLSRNYRLTAVNHRKFLCAVRQIPWCERALHGVAKKFANIHCDDALEPLFIRAASDPRQHPKKLDAVLAVEYLDRLYLKRAFE